MPQHYLPYFPRIITSIIIPSIPITMYLTGCPIMTSSNGNIFRPFLRGEFTGHRWIILLGQWRGALIFSLICAWMNGLVNNSEAGDLRRHRDYYDVIVLLQVFILKTLHSKAVALLQWRGVTLEWPHNGQDSVSNHQPHDCLLNRLSRHRSKKTSKLRVTGLCARNSPGTGEFPAQRASNAENPFDDVIMTIEEYGSHESIANTIT